MSDGFGTDDDNVQDKNNGLGTQNESDKDDAGSELDITAEELAALRKRDEAAQAHIKRLESENAEARTKFSELEGKLAGAATLKEVLDKIKSAPTEVDVDALVAKIETKNKEKQAKDVADANWSKVSTKLEEIYGDFKKADKEITEAASKLGMTPQDATALAKRSPDAFFTLFLPKSDTSNSASSARATGIGSSVSSTETLNNGVKRDKAYYNNLRKTNHKLYWSLETQAQMRRDLFNHK